MSLVIQFGLAPAPVVAASRIFSRSVIVGVGMQCFLPGDPTESVRPCAGADGMGLRVGTCLWLVLSDTDSFFENNQLPASLTGPPPGKVDADFTRGASPHLS